MTTMSLWIVNSFPARLSLQFQPLMNFSKHTMFLASLTISPSTICTHLCRPPFIILMLVCVMKAPGWRILEQSFLTESTKRRCLNKYAFSSVKYLVRHLKFSHGFYPGLKFKLLCDQDGCCQRFCTFSGFGKHLHNKHRACFVDNSEETRSNSTVDQSFELSSEEPSCSEEQPRFLWRATT